ncbi:CaiB/BaiF CoA transferase family protein [Nocardia flavorosea]|uniref:CaiB/BaiF CoA transferase family protein n=1 Tax=Nocardia flavorosea TaxID=53429 RepID=UPI0024564D5C|nr:CoA transferase [Nocardia flavorosea]
MTGDTAARPLAGVRIFDLTHVWSGPMSTRVLAALGAEVLKIENFTRPDILRGTGADLRLRYPDADYGTDPLNRNAWFNTQNVGKHSVALDLKSDEGRAAARELVATCDVVVSNYRAGVLSRMGFGYRELADINPAVIVVEMTAFPSTSPQASAAGFGAQFDAASGNTWLSGDEHGPVLTGFAIGDPVGGLFAASAVVTALVRRRETGRGCHIEIPQSEAMMPLFGEAFVAESRGTAQTSRLNGDPTGVPHGLYRTGDGQRLAVGIHDDDQWSALAQRIRLDGFEVTADWAVKARRRTDIEQVEALVTEWAATVTDSGAVVDALQCAGVAARIKGRPPPPGQLLMYLATGQVGPAPCAGKNVEVKALPPSFHATRWA